MITLLFLLSAPLSSRTAYGSPFVTNLYHSRNFRQVNSRTCLPKTPLAMLCASTDRRSLSTIVCVGDVHGQWNQSDESAIRNLNPHLVLFVGDYGDEDVQVTKRIAKFAQSSSFAVATVFGNHDAFYTARKVGRSNCPYDRKVTCRVSEQKHLLKNFDVSYRSASVDSMSVSICGGRNWSWGGPHWKHSAFYREFEDVADMEDSARKISEAVSSSKHQNIIFLSHSGPTGLGDKPSDPCGRDWGTNPGGDFGDSDLRDGIEHARTKGLRVPLAVFGHMHKSLSNGFGDRTMLVTEKDGDSGAVTVMLNAAVVPRHRVDPRYARTVHHFQVVQMRHDGIVETVEEAWVASDGTKVISSILYENFISHANEKPAGEESAS